MGPPGAYTGLAKEVRPIAAPLSLSALSLDVVVALAQRPAGIGASELARAVSGAPTSIQNSLRVLTANGIVARSGARYALRADHPALPELEALALRLQAPSDAIRIVVRASEAVEFACVDEGGFVVGTAIDPTPASASALGSALVTIRRDREDPPPVLQFEIEELARIIRSAIGLRSRIGTAEILKGGIRRLGQMADPGAPIVPVRSPELR